MKRLEFEMQRLELEQQLEDMRERMAREKKTRQQDVAHEQWVTEQKRNLQAIKIEKVSHITGLSLQSPTAALGLAILQLARVVAPAGVTNRRSNSSQSKMEATQF